MKNEIVYAIVDGVAKNVCHVFFANSEQFARRVFDDFFKRAEVPEERKKEFALIRTSVEFNLPETFDEFDDYMVDSFVYTDEDRLVGMEDDK